MATAICENPPTPYEDHTCPPSCGTLDMAARSIAKPTESALSRRRGLGRTLPSLALQRPTPLSIDEAPPAHDPVDEKYAILDKIGSGSAGVVYHATNRETGEEVAIKKLRPHRAGDPEMSCVARREYELLTRVGEHPHIIRATEFLECPSGSAIVLEFFDGQDLQAAVYEKIMPESTAKELILPLFKAVAHLHECSILHRDIKPQNILVSRNLADLRLIDFNVAVCLDDGPALTPTGTQLYKAPECLLGEPACQASDVWASALCLFFMLSGCLPQGRHARDHKVKQVEVSCSNLFKGAEWDDVSGQCKVLLEFCLDADPDKRPSMADILDDQDSWLYSSDALYRSLSLMASMVPGAGAFLSVAHKVCTDAMK